jgi:DNA-binding response OmpR family regulator
MTGLDVCRKLKTEGTFNGTPVFLLTARGQESDEQAGHIAGADRFFTKPFSPKELLRELRNTLGDA